MCRFACLYVCKTEMSGLECSLMSSLRIQSIQILKNVKFYFVFQTTSMGLGNKVYNNYIYIYIYMYYLKGYCIKPLINIIYRFNIWFKFISQSTPFHAKSRTSLHDNKQHPPEVYCLFNSVLIMSWESSESVQPYLL